MNRSAVAPCADCTRGPTGIAGHDSLFSQTMGLDEMHFSCRACKRAWARRPGTGDSYAWEPIGEVAGAATPGRPGTTPP